jgi:hypothetical protein
VSEAEKMTIQVQRDADQAYHTARKYAAQGDLTKAIRWQRAAAVASALARFYVGV